MARSTTTVTFRERQTADLPDVFSEFVVLWKWLESENVAAEVPKHFWLDRERGCSGLDLFAMLLAMWTSEANTQRRLERFSKGFERELAAVIGQEKWPSQSALSRGLASITPQQADDFSRWLLLEALPVTELERDASCYHIDSLGERWRITHFDETVTTQRQRALPEGPDLPTAQREVTEAAGGHPGRKRGELQFARGALQDQGSSRWLMAPIDPGNGDYFEQRKEAVAATALWAKQLELPKARSVMVFDGKSGGVAGCLLCAESGIQFLTRDSNYKRLAEPAVRELLVAATWSEVRDSRSGPTRWATELGKCRLSVLGRPEFEVEARLVISRFATSEKSGCGVFENGYQYEIFMTSLDSAAWPANEVVTLYYGRCGQENRFCQEDRELQLDNVISKHLPGQQVAVSVGLLIWNLRLVLGRHPARWKPTPQPKKAVAPSELVEQAVAPSELVEQAVAPSEQTGAAQVDTPARRVGSHRGSSRLAVVALLGQLCWFDLLRRYRNWSWDVETSALRCPATHEARLHAVKRRTDGSATGLFRVGPGPCERCPLRAECTASKDRRFVKEIKIPLPFSFDSPNEATLTDSQRPRSETQRPGPRWTPPLPVAPGPRQIVAPSLVPSVLRNAAAELTRRLRISLTITQPKRARRREPQWLATTDAQRQHRRHTFEERMEQRSLPVGAVVHIDISYMKTDARLFSAMLPKRLGGKRASW